jgi:hypothetical protein
MRRTDLRGAALDGGIEVAVVCGATCLMHHRMLGWAGTCAAVRARATQDHPPAIIYFLVIRAGRSPTLESPVSQG